MLFVILLSFLDHFRRLTALAFPCPMGLARGMVSTFGDIPISDFGRIPRLRSFTCTWDWNLWDFSLIRSNDGRTRGLIPFGRDLIIWQFTFKYDIQVWFEISLSLLVFWSFLGKLLTARVWDLEVPEWDNERFDGAFRFIFSMELFYYSFESWTRFDLIWVQCESFGLR